MIHIVCVCKGDWHKSEGESEGERREEERGEEKGVRSEKEKRRGKEKRGERDVKHLLAALLLARSELSGLSFCLSLSFSFFKAFFTPFSSSVSPTHSEERRG